MATQQQIHNFQNAMWLWNRHHVHDLLGDIKVDGIWGSMTKKVGLRSAYYFGVGQPTIRQWDQHWIDQGILNMTDWWLRPSDFYKTHRFAHAISIKRIAQERAKRVISHVVPAGGLVWFDGAHIAAWIEPVLVEARNKGWGGTIPDKTYGGFRTYGQQNQLYQDYVNGGGIAASPDLPSNHQLKDWDGGAVDCSDYDNLQNILDNQMNTDLGRFGPDFDPVHFSSRHRFNNTGHI